ncbi:MAG TPA: ABC transporter substrate-binding protein [Stellaceae bacterium]|nr:ABC transporter substrate-binding protein [Stellaceae bacterium]
MRRREFIAALGGVAAAPLGALAELPHASVAWLSALHPSHSVALPFLLKGLAATGYVEGRNLTIEDASAEGHPEQFPARAAEAVQKHVSLIAAVSGLPSVAAAKAATASIPIVFISIGDPVELGLVASLNHPGGNLTGVENSLLIPKQVELLSELIPGSAPIAMLVDPNTEASLLEKAAKATGQALGRPIIVVTVTTDRDFETAFATVVQQKAAGVVIGNQPILTAYHKQLAELAARFAVPAIYDPQDLAASGGLVSYGANIFDIFRQLGEISGKILAGANPAEFPVQAPDRIQLKINLKTAKALGITVPPSILVRADEVIE